MTLPLVSCIIKTPAPELDFDDQEEDEMDGCKAAEKMVELRTAKGVTQEEVAQKLGVSNKTVSKWETGVSLR